MASSAQPRKYRYLAIADEIRAKVDDGSLEPGSLLPTEFQLSEAYDASRVTIRKALDSLRTAGLVEPRRGYGWSVVGRPIRRTLATRGFEEPLIRAGVHVERRVLEFALTAPPVDVAEELGAQRVLYVKLLTVADGVPVALISVWLPEDLAQEVTPAALRSGGSVYDVLPDMAFGRTTQSIATRRATQAEIELLEIDAETPVLFSHRRSEDADGRAVLFAHLLYPGNIMEFVVEVPGGESTLLAGTSEMPRPHARRFA
jgi:GntR family transcriptional regulator